MGVELQEDVRAGPEQGGPRQTTPREGWSMSGGCRVDRVAKRYFKRKEITRFRAKLSEIERKTNDLLMSYTHFPWKTAGGREYATHGFSRRLGTLRRALLNVYKLIPPGTVRVPTRDRLHDAQINIQACIANVYGCIDNLAWVWVYEKGLDRTIPRRRVGLRRPNAEVRGSLRPAFRKYLEERDDWMEYLVDFRDALAHRIPLYVPPGSVPQSKVDAHNDYARRMTEALMQLNPAEYERLGAEQRKLLVFQPLMTHSFIEAQGVVAFHAQLINDFLTIEELANKMLDELKAA
jgi:hypothetical protein